MTADISRHSLRPAQKYTGVVRQQGRLPIDADDTESDDLADLLLRQLVNEAVCTRGSPDDGFTIVEPAIDDGELDFGIAPGSFYLGGTRLATDGAQYSAQPDWLTMTEDDRAVDLPAAGQPRTDLVWLLGWQQTVTATEDAELLEPALGGPDTTARRRAMWRVMVREGVPDTCSEAFADLAQSFEPGGSINGDQSEIVSNARLTVGFTQLEPLQDLCRPQAQAGFLGARNEAFRVMINRPGRFVWGRDNSAPLYRVKVGPGDTAQTRKISFLTLPRDEFGWPLAGMTVEVLRWGSVLANLEKAAEPLGLFTRVSGGFDPGDDNSIVVTPDDPAAFDAFVSTPMPPNAVQDEAIDPDGVYLFLRVWTGGGAGNAADHPMPVAQADPLGDTGLTLQFAGGGLPGDYWTIAARPNTPTRVLPWALLSGAPPAGPRRMIAPLALLPVTSAGLGDPIDCRHHFRPLCEVGACCRVTVGDGRVSFGDTMSIQDAIDRLPEEGGEVCIHPGEYREHVTLVGRRNILITGCGRSTRWLADDEQVRPLLTLMECDGVVVRRVAMENLLAEGVLADVPGGDLGPSNRIGLEDVSILAADRPAIHIREGRGHSVRRCRIDLSALSVSLAEDPDIGRMAAIFLAGIGLTIESCRIGLIDDDDKIPRIRMPVGGIHIAGRSREVLIRDNVIRGGNGHGITLGSAQYVPAQQGTILKLAGDNYYTTYVRKNLSYTTGYGNGAIASHGQGFVVDLLDCISGDGTPVDPGDDLPDGPIEPESAGVLRDIRILANDIQRMGFSGISSQVFSGLGRQGDGDLIAIERVRIVGNRIFGCMRNEVGTINPLMQLFTGWGGIALSFVADAVIAENEITANGRTSGVPICGVFVALGEGLTIRDNRIDENGGVVEELKSGMRGGVVIGLATGGLIPDDPKMAALAVSGGGDVLPALMMSGNIISSPNARALRAVTLGPTMVHGNRFDGAGRSALFTNPQAAILGGLIGFSITGEALLDPREAIDLGDYLGLIGIIELLGGDAVALFNLGVAEDIALAFSPSGNAPQRLRGGETLFADNQVSLAARDGGGKSLHVSSVLAFSADDLALASNQIEVENAVGFCMIDTLAYGSTIRVDGNRFQERVGRALLSLLSMGILNNTSLNQATHCISVMGPVAGRVRAGNKVLIALTGPGKELCARFDDKGSDISKNMANRNSIARNFR